MMILVIGGTGTVGRHVVAELLTRGANFAVGSRHPEKVNELVGPEVRVVPLDLDNEASVKQAVRSAGKLFLLTPGESAHDEQAMRVIEAARGAGTGHVVRLSAYGADANPTYSVGRIHREVELALLASGVTSTILRANHFMENTLAFAPRIKVAGNFSTPSADARISHIAAKDIGAAAAHILMNEGFENQSLDLSGPEANTMAEVADALSRATGRNIEYVPVTDDEWRQIVAAAGMPALYIDALLELYDFDRAGNMSAVNNNVQQIIGRPPQDYRSWALEHAAEFM